MQDQETGSFWSHVTGKALIGPMEGAWLETLPVVQTSWGAWRSKHPETRVLKKGRTVRGSAYERYFRDPDRIGLGYMRGRWLRDRMPGKTLVHGVAIGPHALAVADHYLETSSSITTEIGEARARIEKGEDGGVRAYLVDVDGEEGIELQVTTVFWFAWSAFYPNTQVIDEMHPRSNASVRVNGCTSQ